MIRPANSPARFGPADRCRQSRGPVGGRRHRDLDGLPTGDVHDLTHAWPVTVDQPDAGVPWTEDMRGTEMPGISAFLRVGEEVFHTYSAYGRGIEEFHNGYQYLDLTALGHQEEWEEPKGRAAPLGLQVGGPARRVPDEYES
ncbi:MAG: DUF899 family protein [Kribbellaceae bacterium]